MSEWQPARLRIGHPLNNPKNKALFGPVIRIAKFPIEFVDGPRCNTLHFEVHMDDIRKLIPWEVNGVAVCEHEILTD